MSRKTALNEGDTLFRSDSDYLRAERLRKKRARSITGKPLLGNGYSEGLVSLRGKIRANELELQLYEFERSDPLTENEARGLLYQSLMDYWTESLESRGIEKKESTLIDEIKQAEIAKVSNSKAPQGKYLPQQVLTTLLKAPWDSLFCGLPEEDAREQRDEMRLILAERMLNERMVHVGCSCPDDLKEDWIGETIDSVMGKTKIERKKSKFADKYLPENRKYIAALMMKIWLDPQNYESERKKAEKIIKHGESYECGKVSKDLWRLRKTKGKDKQTEKPHPTTFRNWAKSYSSEILSEANKIKKTK